MAHPTTATQFTTMATVIVPVSDQDRAVAFFVDLLGFDKVSDFGYETGERWVEVQPPGSATNLSLAAARPERPAGIETGVAYASGDLEADHALLRERGVDVDAEIQRPGADVVWWAGAPLAGVPPQFRLRDPDGNSFLVVQQV